MNRVKWAFFAIVATVSIAACAEMSPRDRGYAETKAVSELRRPASEYLLGVLTFIRESAQKDQLEARVKALADHVKFLEARQTAKPAVAAAGAALSADEAKFLVDGRRDLDAMKAAGVGPAVLMSNPPQVPALSVATPTK